MSDGRSQRVDEGVLYEAFEHACPLFAGEEIRRWRIAPDDPPDIVCTTASGRCVGVEVTRLAHQRETAARKRRGQVEQALLAAIGAPPNGTRNFELVVFSPNFDNLITRGEFDAFRKELLTYISEADRRWTPGSRRDGEFGGFPLLTLYLRAIRFEAGTTVQDSGPWIVPIAWCDSFNDETMASELSRLVRKKASRCVSLKTPCDDLYLLVAYEAVGITYNSPIRDIKKIVDCATKALGAETHPFRDAFLFKAVDHPCPTVYRLLRP